VSRISLRALHLTLRQRRYCAVERFPLPARTLSEQPERSAQPRSDDNEMPQPGEPSCRHLAKISGRFLRSADVTGVVPGPLQANRPPTERSEKETTALPDMLAHTPIHLEGLSRTKWSGQTAAYSQARDVRRRAPSKQEKAVCSAYPLFVRFKQRRETVRVLNVRSI
jgi:hypothetical protein